MTIGRLDNNRIHEIVTRRMTIIKNFTGWIVISPISIRTMAISEVINGWIVLSSEATRLAAWAMASKGLTFCSYKMGGETINLITTS